MCHVTSAVMTYDLKFTLQHTTAANVGVTNAIASFYRDSGTVFKSPGDFRRFPTTFERCQKCPQMFRRRLSTEAT